jgi:rod shape-determining protein MreC
MGRLLDLLYRYRNLLIFIALEATAFGLVIQYNNTQRIIFDDFVISCAGYISQYRNQWKAYFTLTDQIKELVAENLQLRQELIEVQTQLRSYKYRIPYQKNYLHLPDSLLSKEKFHYIPSQVIQNDISSSYNYLIINSGSNHNVKRGMGVFSSSGVVGMVVRVGPNFSIVMSLLNKNARLYVKIAEKNIPCIYEWSGDDPLRGNILFIPLHFQVSTGDVVVTNSNGTIFPEGFKVGTIETIDNKKQDGFYDIQIRLSTDFYRLQNVYLIDARHKNEIDSIENLYTGKTTGIN